MNDLIHIMTLLTDFVTTLLPAGAESAAGTTEAGGLPMLAEVVVSSSNGPNWAMLGYHLLAAVIFSTVGVAVLFMCIWIFEKISHYSFRKEILEDQNTALAIIAGSVLVGVAIIIAAAIMG